MRHSITSNKLTHILCLNISIISDFDIYPNLAKVPKVGVHSLLLKQKPTAMNKGFSRVCRLSVCFCTYIGFRYILMEGESLLWNLVSNILKDDINGVQT